MNRLKDKVAIITGGSAGIGLSIARIFCREGAKVTIVARNKSKLDKALEELKTISSDVFSVQADVSKSEDIVRVFEETKKQFNSIDILVNNAGVDDGSYACTRTTDENWTANITINEKAIFLCCKEALKYMTESNRGAIVNISSIGGRYAVAGAAYSAAKYGIIGLTKNIAIQYAGTGIRCNAVCPGPVPTEMLAPPTPETHDIEMLQKTGQYIDKTVPFLKAEDVANAVLFFADEASERITGQALVVDGGRCL